MHPALAVELRSMTMVSTTEQRVEEMHARIFQLNRSVGRSLAPPSTCARLRHHQNMEVMKDWRARAFVVHMWRRRRTARDLMKGALPAGALELASTKDLIRGVYHCMPQQLYRDVKLEKGLISNLQWMSKVPAFKPPPPLALAVEYFKERLKPGVVFSMPAALLPESMQQPGKAPHAEAVVTAAQEAQGVVVVAQAAFKPDAVVNEAVAWAAEPPDGGWIVCMGLDVMDHRFFRVVKTNLASRFVQFDSGRRGVCISACELQMATREGRAGLHRTSEQ
jgi:hypothetical protein